MRELDLLLEEYLESRYESLSAESRDGFARLLDCENDELMAWLIEGGTPQDEQLAGVVRQVLDRKAPGA